MIDTHIHLDSKDFSNDLAQVLERAKNNNVESFVIPAASFHTLKDAQSIANTHDNIYYAVGIHPCHADEMYLDTTSKTLNNHVLESLQDSINSPKCKAIGECGLDFYHIEKDDTNAIDMQIQVFHTQIEWAIKYNLPLILHVRDSKDSYEASKEVAKILTHYIQKGDKIRGVFHCYNACEELLKFRESFYYGIGGIITFKNAHDLLSVTPKIPLSKIVLETDAPYLAPTPHRGKRNESSFLIHIAEKLSEVLNTTTNEIIRQTTSNAKMLFGI